MDGTPIEKGNLIARISDPAQKQKRGGALEEGREIYCANLSFKLKEEDIRKAFSKYGTIENITLPYSVDCGYKGYCFVVFSTKVCLFDLFIRLKSSWSILMYFIGGSDCSACNGW